MTETTITTPSWVQALDKYVASKPIEDVAADLGLKPEEIIMLVANENPNGMSSKVKEAVATAALNLNRYPDADAYHLQKAIAEKYGVPQDWVVIGSGSSELLGLAAETVLSEGTTAIYPQYSFSLYPMVARLCGAETIEIPSTGDFNADLDAMADAVDERTRLIFLTNPNNPTGTYLAEKDILDFLDKVPPTVMVLFDEAYVEVPEARTALRLYGNRSSASECDDCPHFLQGLRLSRRSSRIRHCSARTAFHAEPRSSSVQRK